MPQELQDAADQAWFLQLCLNCQQPLTYSIVETVKYQRSKGMPVLCEPCIKDFDQPILTDN